MACSRGLLSAEDRAAAEEPLIGLAGAETVAPMMARLSFDAAADRGECFTRRAEE